MMETGILTVLKLLGVCAIALSGLLGAYFLNSDAKERVRRIDGLIALVRHIKTEIECFALPIPKILERCPRELLLSCGYCRGSSPANMQELFEGTAVFDGSARTSLEALCQGLGRGYREEQLSLCESCERALEERRRQLSSSLASKIKMNSALCLGGALAAVILFL